MGQINQPSNLIDQVVALRKEVDELRKRVGIGNATISGGTFTVQGDGAIRMIDADGTEILYFGPDSEGRQVIRLARDQGKRVLYTYAVSSGRQYWALTDSNNDIVVSDDAESGVGLARPWIPVSFELVRGQDMPTVTNGNYETVWEANFNKAQPFIELYTVDGCDSGTTGGGRIMITPVGGTEFEADAWTNGPGLGRHYRGPYALPGGTYTGPLRVSVQYRRTSGTGNVYAIAMDATQRQT
ncbi:hypothetical protein GCM10009745_76150 [Kribbella yunnanensis]|uniref:Uncharacterized protein n=1 Tax=Kribbella yunnanensis TaxID=190194 RepID=A0ABN2J2Q8_9ACTN